jgi:tetratricopeptide (TPR) repeat protein
MTLLNMFRMVFLAGLVSGFAVAQPNSETKMTTFTKSVQEETLGNYQRAIQTMQEISKEYADDYLVNLRLGWLYYNAKDYEKSTRYYRESIRISNNSIEALLGITLPYAADKKWDKVEGVYRDILERDKQNYTANLHLGQIYFNAGNHVAAKTFFERVYELFPGDYESNLYLGWTYYNLGSASKAHRLFVNALILTPGSTSALEGYRLTK